jgi:nucleotide-binding universal stress UspA family protein
MQVLVAIVGSAHSEAAVAEVARRPWPTGTEVEILTVIHPAEELRQQAPMLVSAACEQFRRGTPELSVITKIVEGVPKDLIVVGSHGYGHVWSVLLGSVARAVVTDAACSVLVARAKRVVQSAESAA